MRPPKAYRGLFKHPPPPPPTFPARPMNGGKLELAEPLEEDWRYRPKYNGRRVLFHVPTMRTWNRNLEENAWSTLQVFRIINVICQNQPLLEWLDLELLHGKISVGKKSVIILDYVSEETWLDRQAKLQKVFGANLLNIYEEDIGENEIYLPPIFKAQYDFPIWEDMPWEDLQEMNTKLGCTFYEGLVAYNINQPYPIQLFSPTKETRHWIKYRFIT